MKWALCFLVMLLPAVLRADRLDAKGGDELYGNFLSPPETTKPRCYWYWVDGHVSKEGITKDLEAMKRVGIGGAYIGIIGEGSGMPANPEPKALTEAWWANIEHAIREAGRVGIDIGLFNSPGWSMSGGPWVKPGEAMRFLVQPEIRVKGPQMFSGLLPKPVGDFQDVAVLAFPAPAGEDAFANETNRTATQITFEMPAPFTARSLTVKRASAVDSSKQRFLAAELKTSQNGQDYETLKSFKIDRGEVVLSFPPVSARWFRVEFNADTKVGDIRLAAAPRLENYQERALHKTCGGVSPLYDSYLWGQPDEPGGAEWLIDPKQVRNLTDRISPEGVLKWEVPAGEWIIVRAGMVPTGRKNAPAPAEATGFEVDKMSRAHLRNHFNAYIGHLLGRMPAADRRALKYVIADSYECGPQNWTDGFEKLFQERYGYDPLPFLPAMQGRVVGNADRSSRFLWDLRRLIADRIATEYVGGMRELCHEHGLKLWMENYGHNGWPAEFLQYGGQGDEIGAEFWIGWGLGSQETRAAASAAHIYGKPVVWAEAFTSVVNGFSNTPRELKKRGDWAYTQGVNQYVLHLYIHQPWEDRQPGINAWGTEFHRHNTWFGMMGSWIDYQRRCSALLQQGVHVADVAWFIGEDTPQMTGPETPKLPPGYDYDYINAEVLLTRSTVSGGKLALPGGKEYRLLILPPSETMRPQVLEKIAGFAAAGLPVLGSLPKRSPSLENYPACDEKVRGLSERIKGLVLSGTDVAPALKVPPDFNGAGFFSYTHRRTSEADIYFVTNPSGQPRSATAKFRVTGRVAELWHPDIGRVEPVLSEEKEGMTHVPLMLERDGSVFVVFRDKPTAGAAGVPEKMAGELPVALGIEGAWTVQFGGKPPVTFEALTDWTQRSEPWIKHYAGTAVYRKSFEWDGKQSDALLLDLGDVGALAEVTLNGKAFPALWKAPYRIEVTGALKPGQNELQVRVANSWINRLLAEKRGVADAGESKPWLSNWKTRGIILTQEASLQPSGLIGPVRVLAAVQ